MKQTFFLLLLAGICCARPQLSAGQTGEAALIQTLQSPASSPKAKADACAELKRTGTVNSIPALAALLTDPELSHSARYVLETIPDAKAGQALLDALPQTSGLISVGIINSLAMRGEMAAIPALGKLLSSTNEAVAVTSAEALGRLGGPQALKFLQRTVPTATNSIHDAEVDGILICANRLLDTGKQREALKVFQALYETEKTDRARLAAFRGMILASGKKSTALVADAIVNGDAATQSAALHLASQLTGTNTTTILAGLVPKATAPMQLALVQCLAQRGDPVALPTVEALANSSDPNLRLAAIMALGRLGDDSTVQLLAEKAATAHGAERDAARESLLELNRGPVTSRSVALLKTASPPVGLELLRALSSRGDQAAVPAIVELSQKGNDSERTAALQALGQLADATQIARLVQMVADAPDDQSRSDAADAVNAVYQRIQTPGSKPDVTALVKAIQTGSIETRLALLPVGSGIAHVEVRAALRAAMADPDARIRDSAVHAICDTRDPELLPDLVKLACYQTESRSPLLAIRACVRLATQEDTVKLSNVQKLDAFRQILGTPLNTADKRLILSALGTVADDQALTLANGMLEDATVKSEAEQAVIKIAGAISGTHPAEARNALKKVLAVSTDAATHKSAQTTLNKIK